MRLLLHWNTCAEACTWLTSLSLSLPVFLFCKVTSPWAKKNISILNQPLMMLCVYQLFRWNEMFSWIKPAIQLDFPFCFIVSSSKMVDPEEKNRIRWFGIDDSLLLPQGGSLHCCSSRERQRQKTVVYDKICKTKRLLHGERSLQLNNEIPHPFSLHCRRCKPKIFHVLSHQLDLFSHYPCLHFTVFHCTFGEQFRAWNEVQ